MAPPQFTARLFGTLDLRVANQSCTPHARKTRGLLAYILLAGPSQFQRDQLAALLWPDRRREQGLASLRQAVRELQPLAVGDHPAVIFGRHEISIRPANIATDIAALRTTAAAHDAAAMATIIGERPAALLAGFEPISQEFDDWLALERAHRHEERRTLVLATARAALAADAAAEAFRLARALFDVDLLDEEAAALAIEAGSGPGRHGAMRSVYKRHAEAMQRELGVELPPAIIAGDRTSLARAALPQKSDLAAIPSTAVSRNTSPRFSRWRLSAGLLGCAAIAYTMATEWPKKSPPNRPRVLTVEPLRIAASDPPARALGQGLADDLARAIVGYGSALLIVDPEERPPAASAESFVIDGEAQSDRSALRATVRLHTASDPAILWSKNFERGLGDTDGLRLEIASKLADVTSCALGGHDPPPKVFDTDVIPLFLAACEERHGDWGRSARLLRDVVARAPDFARAWAMLAAATSASDRSLAGRTQADAYARHALALDPHEGDAYFTRAVVRRGFDEWRDSVALARRGVAVAPQSASLRTVLYLRLMSAGRVDEAVRQAEQACALGPFAPVSASNLIDAYAVAGRLADARAEVLHARRLWPDNQGILSQALSFEALLGDPTRASVLFDDPMVTAAMASDERATWQALIAARTGVISRNRAITGILRQARTDAPDLRMTDALALATLHDTGDSLALVAELPSQPLSDDTLFAIGMARLRQDPGFMRVAARQGLAKLWLDTGQWPDFCRREVLPYRCESAARTAVEDMLPSSRVRLDRRNRPAKISSLSI